MKEIDLVLNNVTNLGEATTLFKRKNLSIDDFKKTGKGYSYKEFFRIKKTECRFQMIIHGNDPKKIFELRNNKISIRGTLNGFSVFANFDLQKVPFQVESKSGCVDIYLECMGSMTKTKKKKGGSISKRKKAPSSYTPYTHTNVSKPYGGM